MGTNGFTVIRFRALRVSRRAPLRPTTGTRRGAFRPRLAAFRPALTPRWGRADQTDVRRGPEGFHCGSTSWCAVQNWRSGVSDEVQHHPVWFAALEPAGMRLAGDGDGRCLPQRRRRDVDIEARGRGHLFGNAAAEGARMHEGQARPAECVLQRTGRTGPLFKRRLADSASLATAKLDFSCKLRRQAA